MLLFLWNLWQLNLSDDGMYNGNCGLYFTLSCDDGEKLSSRKGGRKIFISFMALSDWKIVFRLNYCLTFTEPKKKRSREIFPKISSFLFVLHWKCFFAATLALSPELCITLDTFHFRIPCEAIIFDLLRSPKLYFCSFLFLMPCHTVRNNKLAFTSCSLPR